MSENLPNWNLKDFYTDTKDDQINIDLDAFREFSESFNKKYKENIEKNSDNFESVIEEYENGNEIGDKLGNYAFLMYATNMNNEEIVQFYQGINEKLTEISSNLIFFTNEINSLSEEKFLKLVSGSGRYENWLINIRRFKDHQLDEKSEQIFLDKNLTANSSWLGTVGRAIGTGASAHHLTHDIHDGEPPCSLTPLVLVFEKLFRDASVQRRVANLSVPGRAGPKRCRQGLGAGLRRGHAVRCLGSR